MAEHEEGARVSAGADARPSRARKACCLVSEMLEEAGFDRRKARALKRQVLEGLILLCRWQLERMGPEPDAPRPRRAARKVVVQ
jgi:hypothetical protein